MTSEIERRVSKRMLIRKRPASPVEFLAERAYACNQTQYHHGAAERATPFGRQRAGRDDRASHANDEGSDVQRGEAHDECTRAGSGHCDYRRSIFVVASTKARANTTRLAAGECVCSTCRRICTGSVLQDARIARRTAASKPAGSPAG